MAVDPHGCARRAQAAVSLLGAPRSVKFFCNLQPISGVRLREVFIEGEAFGFRSLLPGTDAARAPPSDPGTRCT
eukprot:1522049-Prymnesium_polylepis.1